MKLTVDVSRYPSATGKTGVATRRVAATPFVETITGTGSVHVPRSVVAETRTTYVPSATTGEPGAALRAFLAGTLKLTGEALDAGGGCSPSGHDHAH